MIKVCDCIMGSGKSSAAINYMNERPNRKFIYITPFLSEADRIKKECPGLKFVAPSNKIPEHQFKKREHTAELIKSGRNITTTHQAFRMYTDEMIEEIKTKEYTLIIDENIDVLEEYNCHPQDIDMLVAGGYLTEDDGEYKVTDKEYRGEIGRKLLDFVRTRELICINGEDRIKFYYWILSAQLISAFKDVFILTYLFEGQSIHHLLEIHNMKYEYIGVDIDKDGRYVFCDGAGHIPEYVYDLKNKIHIIERDKMNEVGEKKNALSKTWFSTNDDGIERLRRNIYNCIRYEWRDVPCDRKLWGSFKSCEDKLRGKGYSKSFLVFNARSTNEYRNSTHLVYAVNVFLNTNIKLFYYKNGVNANEDLYALSVLVQWVWRSAIRDGEDIYLYIPSKRMRELFINWIDEVSNLVRRAA